MTHVIAEPCAGVKDTTCVEACPVDCIHGSPDSAQLFIDPVACIDCGLCVDVCPVLAIFPLDDLPRKWRRYADLNAAWFGDASRRTERARDS